MFLRMCVCNLYACLYFVYDSIINLYKESNNRNVLGSINPKHNRNAFSYCLKWPVVSKRKLTVSHPLTGSSVCVLHIHRRFSSLLASCVNYADVNN